MDVEFKLFGSLTIRQFISLAGGIIFAVLTYMLPIPAVLKWPVIVFSVLLGLAMTFITVNGLPFSRWFTSFVLALFSSQSYVWRKSPKKVKPLTKKVKAKSSTKENIENKAKKELGRLPLMDVVVQKEVQLDGKEEADLNRIEKYFASEFKKYEPKFVNQGSQRVANAKRIDPKSQNIAGQDNPIGNKQEVVEVGQGVKQVYNKMTNRKERPAPKSPDEVESRIQEILVRQQELEKYLQTQDIEQREKDLKAEMRKLYSEIQQLKKQQNG